MGNLAAWAMGLSILLAALPAQGSAVPRPTPVQAATDSAAVATARQDWRRQVQATGANSGQALNARFLIVHALIQDGRHIEAETEARAIEAAVRPMAGPKALATLQIQGWIGEILMNQGRLAEAEAYALPVYRSALASYGANTEVTDRPRMTLAGIFGVQDRDAEAAPLAQASFDYYRHHGQPDKAAEIAGSLAIIYRNLDQEEAATQVLILAPRGGPQQLRNVFDASDDPVVRQQTARGLVEASQPGSQDREGAERRLVLALTPLAQVGDRAAYDEALTLARRLLANETMQGDPVAIARLENGVAQLVSRNPSEDAKAAGYVEAAALGQSALARMRTARGDDDPQTVSLRMSAAIYTAQLAMLPGHADLVPAALVELEWSQAYATSHPGVVSKEDAGSMAIVQAGLRVHLGDEGGAYRSVAVASGWFQSVAEARARTSGNRNYMSEWSDLTRSQVRRAWDYAETLIPSSAEPEETGRAEDVPDASGPVG
ncbi:hypothetical protein [Brevundimonas sp.]|uniref:hypothetical protein n=1 Tax=Brevundimonas sp. TaxID=1871086 RepID=UPI001A2F8430|nr:hypothetical protein [Brevundimonas sp.]MBJ7485132.1 hypothetical protein [Brevundimonas sp.]